MSRGSGRRPEFFLETTNQELRTTHFSHPLSLYWLRRIPTETRIVVLVVFLALFQAILLSVFGLGAIRRERERVAEQLADRAREFLRISVAERCQIELRDRAAEVLAASFDARDAEWRTRPGPPGGGLVTDVFLLRPDGSVLAPDGALLWIPETMRDRHDERARVEAGRLVAAARGHGYDAAELARRQLAFARDFPFARDAFGRSRTLVHATSSLLEGRRVAVPELLAMRWTCVLNRIAGAVDGGEVDRFLALVERRGEGDEAFAAGRAEQERRAGVLAAFVAERPHFRPGASLVAHRNVRAGERARFLVRRVGDAGDLQALALDPARLAALLESIPDLAKPPEGVRARIVPGEDASSGPTVAIAGLPGFVAEASISPSVIRARAADRERFYWYIIAFSVAGILAGGLLTARAVMREVKLAKLKAGFVSNVSHGLKTPLTSIRMFADMLRSGQVRDEAEREECLRVIGQETERLSRLIQQVLDFGRLEARKHEFRWTVGSLAPLVEREATRFRRATGLSADWFRVRIAMNQPAVTHDPDAFAEAVANLLSNAFKYTDSKSRRIELTLGPQRGRVVLAVEDNGPGIPPRERRKIFEQFYRAGDLLTRDVEGTGLGLSITRNIVRAHGGRILVEDSPLGGSRFVVVLPAAPRRSAATVPASAEASP